MVWQFPAMFLFFRRGLKKFIFFIFPQLMVRGGILSLTTFLLRLEAMAMVCHTLWSYLNQCLMTNLMRTTTRKTKNWSESIFFFKCISPLVDLWSLILTLTLMTPWWPTCPRLKQDQWPRSRKDSLFHRQVYLQLHLP